jgi:hypothetical protein
MDASHAGLLAAGSTQPAVAATGMASMAKWVAFLAIVGAAGFASPATALRDRPEALPRAAPMLAGDGSLALAMALQGEEEPADTASAFVPTPEPPPAPRRVPRPAAAPLVRPTPADLEWTCNYRREDVVPQAKVRMSVAVDAGGAPTFVTVLHDPGNGFAEVARACAMKMRFVPARDRSGRPMAGTTAPFTLTFENDDH